VFKAKPLTSAGSVMLNSSVWGSWTKACSTQYTSSASQPGKQPKSAVSDYFVALKRIYPTSGPAKLLSEAKLLKTLGYAINNPITFQLFILKTLP